jgi:hypothetical protein
MRKDQIAPEPGFIILSPVRHIDPTIRSAQDRAQRHQDHFRQIMPLRRSATRVRQLGKGFRQRHVYSRQKSRVNPIPPGSTRPRHNPLSVNDFSFSVYDVCVCDGPANQIDDDLVADQWTTAPVHADEREQSMLDLVPLAGARWKMTNPNRESQLVGERLQFLLPQAHPRAVATHTVCGDGQFTGPGIHGLTHGEPPAAD